VNCTMALAMTAREFGRVQALPRSARERHGVRRTDRWPSLTQRNDAQLRSKICSLIAEDLNLPDLQADDDLVHDHRKDELDLQHVAMLLEKEFSLDERSVSEEALASDSTIEKCVELVSKAIAKA
jgi:hypothetical protein